MTVFDELAKANADVHSAFDALHGLGKSAGLEARGAAQANYHAALWSGIEALEKAVGELQNRFAAESVGQYAAAPVYADGEKARIAALEAELADLRKRASADSALSGLYKTVARGAATCQPGDAENPLTSAGGELKRN